MASVAFLGTVSTAWTNAANWRSGVAAHLGDQVAVSSDASIGNGSFYYGNSSLTSAGLTLLSGTVLAFSQLLVKDGTFTGGTLEGTDLYAYGTVSVEATTLQSDVVSGSVLAADVGIAGWITTLDNYYGPGGIWITHQLTVSGTAGLLGNGITLQNASVVFSGGASAGQLTIESDATLDAASGSGSGPSVVGPGQLVNEGTISVEQGATLEVQATLDNTGSITVAAQGVLDLQATVSTADLATVDGGGQVVVGGTLDNSGAMLDLASLTSFSLSFGDVASGGVIEGGTLDAAGGLLDASTSTVPTVLNGVVVSGLLDFDGSIKVTGGTSFVSASGGAGGAVRVEDGALILDGYGTLHGLSLELAGGTLTATAPTQLAADVAVTVCGNARIDSAVATNGMVTVEAGDTLTVGDTSTTATTVTALGSGARLEAPHSVAGVVDFDGTLGSLELSGTGALSATLSQFEAGDSVRFDAMSSGTVSLAGNVLRVSAGASVATFNLTNSGGTPYTLGDFQLSAGPGGALVLTTTHSVSAAQNPLFDQAYYLAHYGAQVAASGLTPYQHFLQIGWKEGLNPDAWFDTSFYLNQNHDVAASGVDPLLQYEATGWREGRAPSLLFSGAAYVAANPASAGTDPLIDYIQSGAAAAGTTSYAPGQGAAADPLVEAGYLFAQWDATLSPSANQGAEATTLYKAGGWRTMANPNLLFDTTFYMNTHRAEVLASGLDPLTHYETVGWREGYDPSLVFSTSTYLAAHPAAATSGVDPLTYSLTVGQQASPVAHSLVAVPSVAPAPVSVDPLLDTASVAQQIATLIPAGGADPAAVDKAYQEGAWQSVATPNPLFQSFYYLAANPDVAAAGVDPLAHYETSGWHEGRDPDPLFNTSYYLQHNPDVAAAGVDPLAHFETSGWHEGRNPDPLFNTSYYLQHNPDVAAAGIDPLVHFESGGWREGRNPDALFDVKYYLAHNPDVAASGVDPLVEYDQTGWKEGRNPSALFNTNAYLQANPDVRAAGIDPLAHYLQSGIHEGRAIYPAT